MDQSDFFFSFENIAAQELEKGILIKSLSLGKNQLRHMVFEPETMIPNHRHPEEVVTMILEGEMTVGEETRRIKSGDVFRVPPDTDPEGIGGKEGVRGLQNTDGMGVLRPDT